MRKLVFILALFCCTTQVMAQCPAFQSGLSGKCLFVTAGAKHMVGPVQFLNSLPFQFVASDTFIPGSKVQGLCVNNKISWDVFVLGTLTQSFFGTLSDPKSSPITASGNFSAGSSQKSPWTATVGLCCPSATPNTCGSKCVNLQNDTTHCGGCGKTCTGGKVCTAGVCVCPPGKPNTCGSRCVNLQNDATNCGICGHQCPAGLACKSGGCCKPKAAACSTNSDCCAGLTCSGGVCKPPCAPGADCTVPGKKGPCASGQLDCSGIDPACKQITLPQPDTTCDGKDENCNGIADDGYVSHACLATNLPGCQSSFSAPAKSICNAGVESCDAKLGVDFCTGANNAACGVSGATPCTQGVTKCAPGYVCKQGATLGCNVSDSSTACWPVDGAHCTGCPGQPCYKPSDVTVGGACPP